MGDSPFSWLDNLPDDYFAKANLFTDKFYRDVYPFINPEDPRLSQKGKVVVITGASNGIGREALAISFAKAGAKALYLASRSQTGLEETRKQVLAVNPNIEVNIKAMDITVESSVKELFEDIKAKYGKADVLLNSAGIAGGNLLTLPIDEMWRTFEVHVKGSLTMSHYFAALLGTTSKGYIINITSASGPIFMPGTDIYGLASLMKTQMQRYITVNHPNIFAASMQPGAILTGITLPPFRKFSKDTPALAGGVAVWLASEEAGFLNGRYVDANWDMEEVLRRKEEIVGEGLLQMVLKGDLTKGLKL